MYYLLYKKMSFLVTLASMSFFKRSGTYNLFCFGRVGYKNNVKTTNTYGNTRCFLQTSDCAIIYRNKNKLFVALSAICDTFVFKLTSKNVVFICLGETSCLDYKVGKLIFFLRVVFGFYTL